MELAQFGIFNRFQLTVRSGLHNFSFRDASAALCHCHPVITRYCAHTAQSRNTLAVFHGTRFEHPCYRCTVEHSTLNLAYPTMTSRTKRQTLRARQKLFVVLRFSEQAANARRSEVARTNKLHALHRLQKTFPSKLLFISWSILSAQYHNMFLLNSDYVYSRFIAFTVVSPISSSFQPSNGLRQIPSSSQPGSNTPNTYLYPSAFSFSSTSTSFSPLLISILQLTAPT